ncbi:restriction endonuclease subunit S, partial [Candidatus Parcubacteria bacterium]
GDILYGKLRPYLDKAALAEWDGVCSTDILVLIPKEVNSLFGAYLMHSSYVLQHAIATTTGVNHPRTSWKALAKGFIPLPPLPEQRAIAHVLRAVQRAKEATDRVIAAARELKKSLMRHLFTYGPVPVGMVVGAQRAAPLRETEIGPLPAHWRVVKLGEVAEVRGGKRLPKGHKFAETRTPYPYLRVTDFRNGSIDTQNLKYLTPEDYEILKRYTISTRDVYISIAGTIGLVGTVPPELDGANLTENAAKLVIIDRHHLLQTYLVYALMSERCQSQIHQRSTKTSQPKLALSRIRQIRLPLPPLDEQREIARLLQAVDEKIRAEEGRKAALEALFQTLLHDLMTARRRLPPEFVARFAGKHF